MLIQISHANWLSLEDSELYYVNEKTAEIICKVEEPPSFDYIEITDAIPSGFTQAKHKGSFGERLNLETMLYIDFLKVSISVENAEKASTITELELFHENALLEDEVDTLALEILTIKGV